MPSIPQQLNRIYTGVSALSIQCVYVCKQLALTQIIKNTSDETKLSSPTRKWHKCPIYYSEELWPSQHATIHYVTVNMCSVITCSPLEMPSGYPVQSELSNQRGCIRWHYTMPDRVVVITYKLLAHTLWHTEHTEYVNPWIICREQGWRSLMQCKLQ